MFAVYIQRLYKRTLFPRIGLIGLVSTQKKKPQRKPSTHDRLQNIQIFENIQKKRKLSSPVKPSVTPSAGTYCLVSRHYLAGYTKPQSSGLFFDKENQFVSPVPKIFFTGIQTFSDFCQLKYRSRSLYF